MRRRSLAFGSTRVRIRALSRAGRRALPVRLLARRRCCRHAPLTRELRPCTASTARLHRPLNLPSLARVPIPVLRLQSEQEGRDEAARQESTRCYTYKREGGSKVQHPTQPTRFPLPLPHKDQQASHLSHLFPNLSHRRRSNQTPQKHPLQNRYMALLPLLKHQRNPLRLPRHEANRHGAPPHHHSRYYTH